MIMKFLLFVCLCIVDVMAQSYAYNAYENVVVDERDGCTYNLFETDWSKWFVEDLHYIPESTVWTNVLNGELYCESDLKLKRFEVDENDFHSINLLKKIIKNCRKVYYKWDLAVTSCPRGWHLATTEEWNELSVFLKKNPFLQKFFFRDFPNYVSYHVKGKKEYVVYDHLSKWWHADLDGKWKKNTRARVTSLKNKKIEIKEDVQFGSVFWSHTHHGSWVLLPARCVENKKGVDYSVSIPEIDTSSSIKFGHGLNAEFNGVSKLRLDQLM